MHIFGELVHIFEEFVHIFGKVVHIFAWKLVSRTSKQVSRNLGPIWQPGVYNDTIRIMRSPYSIQNPSNPENAPQNTLQNRNYRPKCEKIGISPKSVCSRIFVGIFESEAYFGVYFRNSKGFVFCTGTA